MSNQKISITIDQLDELYTQNKLSSEKIGLKLGCSGKTVRNRLDEYKIQKRNSSEARMKYEKRDFSGDNLEKCYILGFRLGDLNIYQTKPTSSLIVARCSTTREEQIKLIQSCFSQYGHITVKEGRRCKYVTCFLNKSFDFLLPKGGNIPELARMDQDCGAAFIAGYVDAEGNFLLNQGRARFKIESYDYEILSWMNQWLNMQMLNNKFYRSGKINELRSDGTFFKKDLWRLNINEAICLLRFIEMIMPFSKHATRLKQMELCLMNINNRLKNGTIKSNYGTGIC